MPASCRLSVTSASGTAAIDSRSSRTFPARAVLESHADKRTALRKGPTRWSALALVSTCKTEAVWIPDCCRWGAVAVAAPWRGSVAGRLAEYVGVRRRRAPTLAASTVDCSNGSYSLDKSLLFFHFDSESVLYFFASRSISRPYSRLCEATSLSSALDPNL